MMTLYMTFEALRDRRIRLDQLVPVSLNAASMEPTKLGLVPGTRITVEQAILGLITRSANDAAAALGELLGGTEERFAQMMTLRARALGMSQTTFRNASGLPDPDQWTTARDLAVLGRRLIVDFPAHYRYFSAPSFVWQGRTIFNHDALLRSYPGADGLKTGYTDASGYNLVSSAVRGGVRLIGVVMGAASSGERNLHMISLLNQGYDRLDIQLDRRTAQLARAMPMGPIAVAQAAEPLKSNHSAEPLKSAHSTETAKAGPSRAHGSSVNWAIQVGSFATERVARNAAIAGQRAADVGEIRIERIMHGKTPAWRALVIGLTAADAQAACHALARRKAACNVMRPESRQIASR
jgi:D-alanyl-D-alanine carboxypeptidase